MDTPRSESPSYPQPAIPAPQLDDHRFQPHSLPRNNTISGPHIDPEGGLLTLGRIHTNGSDRVNASESGLADERPPLGTPICIDHATRPPLAHRGSITRTIDNDRISIRFSRASSRSPSPPNSVDAFADPEVRRFRDRSGTFSSQHPGDVGLDLRKIGSRRPTFSETDNQAPRVNNETGSAQAQEDVCFPPPEDAKVRGGIDFEEMDEFVALQNKNRSGVRQRKMSVAGSFRGRYYREPKIVDSETRLGPVSSPDECAIDDSDESILNEKGAGPRLPRHSHPDRFSFFSSEMDTTIHAPEIGDLLIEDETFYELFRGGQGVWWLDCLNPTPEELAMLMKAFSIHPLTAEDIRVQETREKVELFKSYYFVCFRSFVQDKKSEDYMEPINVYIIVFREGVLSFHFEPSNHSANVRRRIRQLRDYVALSSDWICYALIDDIVDSFAPLINDVEHDSDAIEDAVFVARSDDYTALLKRIGDCRKKTMGGMRLLGGKADVIKGFAKRCNEQYSITPRGEIGLYLGDIQDHIVTMMSNLAHFEKMLSRSHANYLAQLSVDSIQANNRANEVLGKITTIATILVPLNLICGLFGMNVPVPGQESETLYWFFGILGSICVFVVVSFYVAKRWKLV
ncbi:cora-domain-containing protein [Ascodesmis nigricans]|uniref:Cora-domain-containing protein n=1 Tax=Ascodesmis nigricans TaxID=341454 RepID=A0A4V3SJF6_9PEZI|nr:cora-domain-containing protein [Ascodesmis nigricans]